jgi:hypothetical protein
MCWEPYDRDLDYCPKKSCDGDVVEIDDEYNPSKGLRTHAKVAKGIARLALWVDKLPPLDESISIEGIEN